MIDRDPDGFEGLDPSRIGEIDLGPLVPEPETSAPATPAPVEMPAFSLDPSPQPAEPALSYELTPAEVSDFFNSLDKAVRARRLCGIL